MKKFYTELAYIIGLMLLAFGTAFMEKANFGMSMVVAPAYLVYLKLSETFTFFTFGMAEYLFQALLLAILMITLKKFRLKYLFAFVTTVIYGLMLDIGMAAVSCIPEGNTMASILFYTVGTLLCAAGVSLLFHTYISPEVYELTVKEISSKYGFPMHKCKLCYDIISCVAAIIISFLFFGFGHFEGVKAGTVINALVNGYAIGIFTSFFEKHFVFCDLLSENSRFRSVFYE